MDKKCTRTLKGFLLENKKEEFLYEKEKQTLRLSKSLDTEHKK
jgi:hypothetical protein